MTKANKTNAPSFCSERCMRDYRKSATEVRSLLERLSKAAETNFDATLGGVDDGRTHFGHVGSLGAIKVALREISDQVFKEGEYAE